MPLVQLPMFYWILPSATVLLLTITSEVIASLLTTRTHLALSYTTLLVALLMVGTILLEVLVVIIAWPCLCRGLVQGGP